MQRCGDYCVQDWTDLQGLAIITVLKLGFVGSARFGSGVVVARRPDGSWSAPSAIGTAGLGFGSQLGIEVTDFVFILNDSHAVRTFSQVGSITLGGNVSVAAGPVGRSAEASGAASLKSVAGVFAYSKTKGLFAGVSLEGSVLIERKEANEKMYGRRVSASELLEGDMPVPDDAAPLLRILNSRVFSGGAAAADDSLYNDLPGTPVMTQPRRAATWHDEIYDQPSRADPSHTFDHIQKATAPRRPSAPKPVFAPESRAIAKFTFTPDQPGDLGFAKGDVITIVKRTENASDWWTGRIGERQGEFPRCVPRRAPPRRFTADHCPARSNYVQLL